MAQIVWTETALNNINDIAEYISLDSVFYAEQFVRKIFIATYKLEKHPNIGKVVPELFQEQANPNDMAKELSRYIDEPAHYQATQNKLKQVKQKLGEKGATEKVAAVLADYLRG